MFMGQRRVRDGPRRRAPRPGESRREYKGSLSLMSTNNVSTRVAARASLLRGVRGFFDGRGFLEVDTPVLARSLIPEPTIDVFVTEAALATPLYLVPSPERWMKRLVAAGCSAIYQIGHAFRNLEETGPWHADEFAMLEWYTTGEDWAAARRTTHQLLHAASTALAPWQGDHTRLRTFAGMEEPGALPEVRTVASLCQQAIGSPLVHLSLPALQQVARGLGVDSSANDDWEQLFHRLFLTYVEPTIPDNRPVFVTEYPSSVPTLARTTPDTAVADRWELYLGGVEIANCFQEEVNHQRLSAVFEGDAGRLRNSHTPRRVDWELVERFSGGPLCTGVALGVDRLLAVMLGAPSLEEVAYCDTAS